MSDDLPVFCKRLKEARYRLDISQKSLGIAAGFDEFSASARMNQYERGTHTPDRKTIERIAKVLGVPVPYLYAEDEVMAEILLAMHGLDEEAMGEVLTFVEMLRNKKSLAKTR